jgi:hypothetical protein
MMGVTGPRGGLPGEGADMASTVDIDDLDSWPRTVLAYTGAWATRLAGSTPYPLDLAIPWEAEAEFLDLLVDHPVRTYHCARLLDDEVDDVRRHGLAALEEDLVARKLRAAHTAGAISETEHDELRSSSVFAHGSTTGRLDKVCVVVGRTALDEDDGLIPLLTSWGGEAVYWAHEGTSLGHRLRQLGTPAVVVLDVDLSRCDRDDLLLAPPLNRLFVGQQLGLDEIRGEAHIPRPITAAEVVDIWQPGTEDYDRHLQLPRW